MGQRYNKYMMTVALVAALTSCRKLEEFNPSGSTADAVYTTPAGMLTLVNACYADQRNYYGKEDAILMSEGGTDLWFNANRANYANQLTRYDGFTSSSSGTSRNTYTTLYRGLNLCNTGIGRIGNITYPSITERNQREGEMRFMRAFYLWHIVEFYGGVYLKLTETAGPEFTAQRSAPLEFYKQVIADLEIAAEYLPNSWGLEYSRATKKAALGLMARAALSAGYETTGAESEAFFTKARNTAQAIIDRKDEFQIKLWDNYADLWEPTNNKKVGRDPNGEALYFITNSATNLASNYDGNANRMHLWFLTQYSNKFSALTQTFPYGNDGQRRLMPTRTLLNYYDEMKDSRYAGTFQEVWIANNNYTWSASDAERYKKDPSIIGTQLVAGVDTAMVITKNSRNDEANRKYLLFDRDTTYQASGVIKGSDVFVPLVKFRFPGRTAVNSQPGFNDIFLMRFAEMYLIAAEASINLNQLGAAADYVNVIRTRAALPGKVADMQVNAGQMTLDFILEERAREFAGEHLRWFDVKRIKREGSFANFIKSRNPDISAVADYHRLRPVPQEELNALLNKDEFGQNFGYQ